MSESNRIIFSGMSILIDQEWVKDHAIIIEDKIIKAIIPSEMIAHHLPAMHHIYSSDHYLAPGFIDLHIHGAKNQDVMDADKNALIAISHALAEEGVTGFLATTMTASNDKIEAALKVIPDAMQEQTGAAILGVHLEGPFIAKEKMGAQLASEVKLPEVALYEKWQKLSGNNIKIVTLAPELPGALKLIAILRQDGVIASIGHTHATYDETVAAINAGCTQVTHLFNAMRSMHQREPASVGAALLADQVNAEVIVDGLHLHAAIIDIILRLKGKERLLLVTDAMRAKCLGDGQYDLGGQTVTVDQGKATLADGTLAGSTLRMSDAIKNMAKMSESSLADAIQMAAQNPARVLGIEQRKGSIAVGKDADIAILNATLSVVFTMREGREIYRCK